MKVNIYYGGRGLIEDPTIYVMNKLTDVLKEIRVDVIRYNLYESKNGINMLPKTLKEADGIILAATVEWMGIGGLMQQFLDACWLYGDKEKISSLYMMPVVMANTYGERDAELILTKSWEMLGGKLCHGLCAYVENHVEFETNNDYAQIIEKKAESLYRSVNQKIKTLPTSDMAIQQNIFRGNITALTPQESEQLSMYVSDDTYVKKQKEDIEELTQIFKGMLGEKTDVLKVDYIPALKECFKSQPDFTATYMISISDKDKNLIIEIDGENLNCYYGDKEEADVVARTTSDVLDKITRGELSFQRAFMSGELSAKGNFKTLRTFDLVFQLGGK